MTEPIVRYGIAGTCGDGQGMLIEQHERIVSQKWSALVTEVANLKVKNAEQYQDIERRKLGLQRVWDAIKVVCPEKELAIIAESTRVQKELGEK